MIIVTKIIPSDTYPVKYKVTNSFIICDPSTIRKEKSSVHDPKRKFLENTSGNVYTGLIIVDSRKILLSTTDVPGLIRKPI